MEFFRRSSVAGEVSVVKISVPSLPSSSTQLNDVQDSSMMRRPTSFSSSTFCGCSSFDTFSTSCRQRGSFCLVPEFAQLLATSNSISLPLPLSCFEPALRATPPPFASDVR